MKKTAPFGYLLCQGGAFLLLSAYVWLVGFALRDGFCGPGYATDLLTIGGYVIGASALFHLPGVLIAIRAFGLGLWPAVGPFCLSAVFFALFFGGDRMLRGQSDVSCDHIVWNTQDGTVFTPVATQSDVNVLIWGIMALWIGHSLWISIAMMRRAFQKA